MIYLGMNPQISTVSITSLDVVLSLIGGSIYEAAKNIVGLHPTLAALLQIGVFISVFLYFKMLGYGDVKAAAYSLVVS
jgi:hypothetical protein